MSRYYSYIHTAARILDEYKGHIPLTAYLKNFFSADRKYGSKDRKQIAHLCYCYFRLGKAASAFSTEEAILTGLFLCSAEKNDILATVRPEWNEKTSLSHKEKLTMANLSLRDIFPWEEEVSAGLDYEPFCRSFFQQPDLFLRIRPGAEERVLKKLKEANLDFELAGEGVIRLPNTSKVETVLQVNKEVIIQDYSSQETGIIIKNHKLKITNLPAGEAGQKLKIWDCCAASGGKSIMLYDSLDKPELTVSDIRESIIYNLKKRFAEAGILHYHSFIADLAQAKPGRMDPVFDIIIADVPCSGSGTWARTPEQLHHFEIKKTEEYSALQKKIVTNAIPFLKDAGMFVYITCSVFKAENEEVTDYILKTSKLKLIEQKLITGYMKKADTLFIAVFSS